jgi:spermidine/putrescine transport system permease protein
MGAPAPPPTPASADRAGAAQATRRRAPAPEVRFGEQLTPFASLLRSAFTSGPAIAWVTLFLLVPLLGILLFSVLTRGTYGELQLPFTLRNYTRLAGFGLFGFDPQYPLIILRSLVLAAGTTAVCLLAAFPLSFFIAGLPGRAKQIALTLVIIPFWTNLLIRTYAWQILLAPDATLTRLAVALGLAEDGMPLYPSAFAVYVGMLCAYLPFLVLPLYTAVEKIDWSIAEAASDLGADGPRVFRHAILPQVMPGMVAGMILVFIPATGQFVIPDLLGGAKTVMLGNAIQQQFGASRDWPFGSAVALVAMAVVLLGLWFQTRSSARRGEEGLL